MSFSSAAFAAFSSRRGLGLTIERLVLFTRTYAMFRLTHDVPALFHNLVSNLPPPPSPPPSPLPSPPPSMPHSSGLERSNES